MRTLARAARLVRDWSSWETFGLRGPRPEVDLAATLANAERVAGYAYERRRVADLIRAMGVDLVEEAGDARFLDANTVAAADGRSLARRPGHHRRRWAGLTAADPRRRASPDL